MAKARDWQRVTDVRATLLADLQAGIDRAYSTGDVAIVVRFSRDKVQDEIAAGALRAYRLRPEGHYRVDREELRRYVTAIGLSV